jgi:hypothetical protein
VYNVSHLYVYKSNTEKQGEEEEPAVKKKRFQLSAETETFISLSATPEATVRLIMPKMDTLKTQRQTSNVTLKAEVESFFKSDLEEEGVESSRDEKEEENSEVSGKGVKEEESAKEEEESPNFFTLDVSASIMVPIEKEKAKSKGGEPSTFVVDRSANEEHSIFTLDTSAKSQPSQKKVSRKRKSSEVDSKGDHSDEAQEKGGKSSSSSLFFSGVMGLDEEEKEDTPFFHQARQKKAKTQLKRKLEGESENKQFISFSLAPTTVKSSIANPNKKKKQKNKKK